MQVPQVPHIQVSAIAGAAKSTTIHVAVHKLLERNPDTKIKLLVYGKANADEAALSLPDSVDVSTVHSMAYAYTIGDRRPPLKSKEKPLKLPIRAAIQASDVPKSLKVNHDRLSSTIELAEAFLASGHTSVTDFVSDKELEHSADTVTDALTLLNAMEAGKINITHAFYLKLFHIKILNGTLSTEPVDVLILDEAQDLTQIMIDITDKYTTSQRIFVGDSQQAILAFAGSIDVLDMYKDRGTNLSLTKSFRVNTADAEVVQHFMRVYLDSEFVFEGFDRPYPDNPTRAYLTRTNAALINKMIELDRTGTPFKLATKTKLAQLFNLPLTLATLKQGGKQVNSEVQYLQDTADTYFNSPDLLTKYKTLFAYLRSVYDANPTIIQAMDLVAQHGAKVLFGIRKSAKLHMKAKCDYTLSTVHVAKGKLN